MNCSYITSASARTKTRSSVKLPVTPSFCIAAGMSAGRLTRLDWTASPTKIAPVFWIEMKTGFLGLGSLGLGGTAGGRSSAIETVAIGAATMKMISSTSMMSTNGVTLISLF